MDKKELRKKCKKIRAELKKEYTDAADKSIFHILTALPEYKESKTIFCYVSTEMEIDTYPILEHILSEGKQLGIPRCIGNGIMEVRQICDLKQLEKGMFGIREPSRHCPLIASEDIDLAVVPCLSCTRDGRRLGYGGGYYDRYLEKTSCTKIVLCREKMMGENIPADEWDLKMDTVVTEKGVY